MSFNSREQWIIEGTANAVREEICQRIAKGASVKEIRALADWVLPDVATRALTAQSAGNPAGDALMRAQEKVKTP